MNSFTKTLRYYTFELSSSFSLDYVMFSSGLFAKTNTHKIFIYFLCFSFSMQELVTNILFDTSRIFLGFSNKTFACSSLYCYFLFSIDILLLPALNLTMAFITYSDQSPLPHTLNLTPLFIIYWVNFAHFLTSFDPQLMLSTGAYIRELIYSHVPHDTLIFYTAMILPEYRNNQICRWKYFKSSW